MRFPAIILLSSVALALLAQAEEAPIKGAVKMIQESESPKEIPVGNGIVYTKTTFFKNNQRNQQEDSTEPSSSGKDKDIKSKKKDGKWRKTISEAGQKTFKSATDLAADLLGIGVDIEIGGDKKKKDKSPVDKDAPGYAWYNTPLYGDDGYVPRPVRAGCEKTSLQGSNGKFDAQLHSWLSCEKRATSENIKKIGVIVLTFSCFSFLVLDLGSTGECRSCKALQWNRRQQRQEEERCRSSCSLPFDKGRLQKNDRRQEGGYSQYP